MGGGKVHNKDKSFRTIVKKLLEWLKRKRFGIVTFNIRHTIGFERFMHSFFSKIHGIDWALRRKREREELDLNFPSDLYHL